ncbi:MAG: alpha/beta hydrolase [Aquisalimonadaceae bacterium]
MFGWFGIPAFGYPQSRNLEVIHYPADAPSSGRRPLLFIHGAYVGAWCWEEHFLPYFASRGYDCYALSLSGHGKSDGGEALHYLGIDDYVADVRQVVESLPVEPILIGHSMGGMVVQKYLEHYAAPAVALMAPVPASGLGASVLRMMTADPWLFVQVSLMHGGGADLIDSGVAGRAVFSDDVDGDLQRRYASRIQGESHRALFDMTVSNLPRRWSMQIPPMLVIGADDDALFSPAMVRRTALTYEAELSMLPNLAHAIMLEPNWQRAADVLADWLARQSAAMVGA